MLDGWWIGHTERLAREAPAPVVEIEERSYAPGGAANTAVNLAALGARVRLVGLCGDDDAGERLHGLLEEMGVDSQGVVRHPGIRTMTKTRILSSDHVFARLDDGADAHPVGALQNVASALREAAAEADALVVCDYRSGALEGPVRVELHQRRDTITVVDAHEPGRWRELGARLATPNAEEVEQLLGTNLGQGEERAVAVGERAADILAETGALEAIVTLDRSGTVLLGAGAPFRTHAHPALENKTSGAGDTFTAAATLALASGQTGRAAALYAQAAADVVVQRFGTAVCTPDDIARQLGQTGDATMTGRELLARVEQRRREGCRIVLTNGCFDVLHRGHTSYLHQARALGDVLVVALNSDDSVRRLKGTDRPINPVGDRAAVLAALGCVDFVTVFDDDTPAALISALRPDVYAKGGDYTPDMLEETSIVREYGGEVRMLDYVPAQSTSAVVERIRHPEPSGLSRGAR